MDMNHEIMDLAEQNHLTYCGIADLTGVPQSIKDPYDSGINEYPYSISLGIRLNKEIVDKLQLRAQYPNASIYRHFAYDIVNQRLDYAASIISSYLQDQGYKALPVPASEKVSSENLRASFSHKLAAHMAGLGWIGKSCMLITPKDGPRVRWATILTDAPLQPTGEKMASQCKGCNECVDACPVHAFTGRAFDENEPRESRFDAHRCDEHFNAMRAKGELPVCGMCLYVCPYGRRTASPSHNDKTI